MARCYPYRNSIIVVSCLRNLFKIALYGGHILGNSTNCWSVCARNAPEKIFLMHLLVTCSDLLWLIVRHFNIVNRYAAREFSRLLWLMLHGFVKNSNRGLTLRKVVVIPVLASSFRWCSELLLLSSIVVAVADKHDDVYVCNQIFVFLLCFLEVLYR